MITRMDGYVGKVIELLKDWGIADNTLIMFTSDNGPYRGWQRHGVFQCQRTRPRYERDLTDGGIVSRCWCPAFRLVQFPIALTSATSLRLPATAGLQLPEGRDSRLLPTLMGERSEAAPPL